MSQRPRSGSVPRVASLLALVLGLGLAGPARAAPAEREGGPRSLERDQAERSPRERVQVERGPRGRAAIGQRLRQAIGGPDRSEKIPEKRWAEHPAIRHAIAAFRGERGAAVRLADYDVRARFAGGELTGYTVDAVALGWDGATQATQLEVDPEGRIVSQEEGRGRIMTRLKRMVSAQARRLPGADRMAAARGRGVDERQALIADYAARTGLADRLGDQAADAHIAQVVDYSKHDDSWVYAVSDLHSNTGPMNPNEDLRDGSPAMAKFLATIDGGGARRATLVCGGDCFEFMENAPAGASLAELETYASKFIEGHAEVYRALARAVVPHYADADRGLRFILTRGNHDIHMVDKRVRDMMIDTMARVGGLAGADVEVFRQRVAFAGDQAVLGKQGEWLMMHGDAHDLANNWRDTANPYRYEFSRGGAWNVLKHLVTKGELPPLTVDRKLEANMGYMIVQYLYRYVEQKNPEADNTPTSSAFVVGKALLTNPRNLLRLGKVLWKLVDSQKAHDAAALDATRAEDATVGLEWARRTGVHQQWGLASAEEVASKLAAIRAQMPTPVHERMTSRFRLVNLMTSLFGARQIAREHEGAEPRLIGLLTSALPNVKDVNAGHTHARSQTAGVAGERGRVTYRNTGTWTKHKGENVFTVSVSRAEGGVLEQQGMYRFDPSSAALVRDDQAPAPVWGTPVGWTAAAATAP